MRSWVTSSPDSSIHLGSTTLVLALPLPYPATIVDGNGDPPGAVPWELVLDAVKAAIARPAGSADGLLRLARADMDGVDALILERMTSPVSVIPLLAEHLIAAGGKRLRPLLTVGAAR